MSQSLSKVAIHLVFSTKNRTPWLKDRQLRELLHAELGGISKSLNCPPLITGGIEDHVHLLAHMSRTIALSDWVKELKRVSSLWIKQQTPGFQEFTWQSGYGAISVSQSSIGQVTEYIRRQEEHHQQQDFQAEFLELLKRHQIDYDERYVWD
jgi:putative transposase